MNHIDTKNHIQCSLQGIFLFVIDSKEKDLENWMDPTSITVMCQR